MAEQHRRRRPRVQLVPPGRLHGGRRLVEAHRRDLRGRAHRRGPGRDRRAGRGRDGARAGDDGGLRPLLLGQRHRARRRPRGRDVAPSATRRTPRQFLERAQAASGLRVRVLSGEEEARYGYLAAVNSTTLADGVMLDIGGGSMQLVHVVGRHSRELDSWRLGAVRMSERFLPGDGPAKPKQIRELVGYVTAKLERAPWLERCGPRLVGIGGTIRNLAAAAQRDLDVPEAGVQGYVITREELDRLVDELAVAHAGRARQVPRHQALARRHHPRRRDRRADGHGGRRLRGPRGHRGRPARGRVLRAPPRRRPAAVRRRAPRERRQPRRAVRHGPRAQPARRPRRPPRARASSTSWPRPGVHDGRPRRARAAVGRGAAARHRHDRRLRRPPQALALPRPQRRAARLRAARDRAHRPGGALPPQGHALAGPVRPAGDQGRRGAPEPHVGAACGWPRTSSARATSSCARPTSPSTTARCASTSTPTATTASRAGPRGARPSSSRAPSTVS